MLKNFRGDLDGAIIRAGRRMGDGADKHLHASIGLLIARQDDGAWPVFGTILPSRTLFIAPQKIVSNDQASFGLQGCH